MSEQLIGPALPPDWPKANYSIDKELKHKDKDESEVIGPSLPPDYHLNRKTSPPLIGPQIPIHLRISNEDNDEDSGEDSESESDSDSDQMIGPMPESHKDYDKHNYKYIKNGLKVIKEKKDDKEVLKREEWMTEIPKPLARKLGMKSVHQFSQKSSKNIDLKSDANEDNKHLIAAKNEEMSELMNSYNKRNARNVSLLDIHTEKRKKSKSSDKSKERVPFDPEKDLSVRKMDSKQTKSVIDKAQAFNDRFSLGTNKFL